MCARDDDGASSALMRSASRKPELRRSRERSETFSDDPYEPPFSNQQSFWIFELHDTRFGYRREEPRAFSSLCSFVFATGHIAMRQGRKGLSRTTVLMAVKKKCRDFRSRHSLVLATRPAQHPLQTPLTR